jgi:hypothetical protein
VFVSRESRIAQTRGTMVVKSASCKVATELEVENMGRFAD